MKKAVLLMAITAAAAAGAAIFASSGGPAAASPQAVQAPVMETWRITAPSDENYRYPGVAEDSKGNRLVIFRGPEGTLYDYSYCPKGGTWSSPKSIGTQPALIRALYANIRVDSTDRFHCEWEDGNGAVYATFKDGVWTTPIKPSLLGRYDFTSSIALRSNDEVVTADCEIIGLGKDVYFHVKGKNDAAFGAPIKVTNDAEGSTQPSIAVDSNDNLWLAWKSDYPLPGRPATEDNLVIYLSWFKPNNEPGGDPWIVVSPNPGWSFLPQVAVNSEDKVMTLMSCSTYAQYLSRLYDPATKTLGSLSLLRVGLPMNPWHRFFSRLASHNKDFYAAVLTVDRILKLMKYDPATNEWAAVATISDKAVEIMDLYSGYDRMIVAYSTWDEPTAVYVTAVEVEPRIPLTQQLTLQATPGGTTIPAPGTYTHPRRAVVNITAVPDLAYKLASWSGDASGTATSIAVTLDADKTVKANFQFVIQPPLNFQVQNKVERGLFNAFYLNLLTWEANILNTQQGDVVAAYRIYRKPRTDPAAPWTRLAEVTPAIFSYVDSKLLKTADYVYTITTVHKNGDESAYY